MDLQKRKNHRLTDYDYGSYGYYFITICTYNKQKLLSKIVNGKVVLTKLGIEVKTRWENIAKLNDNVELRDYVIMPNHLHGIIVLRNQETISQNHKYSFQFSDDESRRSLKGIIRDFKSITTRIYKQKHKSNHSLWQASFYDEIIRNEKHYLSVRKYIEINPLKWDLDKYY